MVRAANLAHLAGHPLSGLGGRLGGVKVDRDGARLFRLHHVKGFVTFSAKGVAGPELDQGAESTAHYLACIHAH
jgi:hypothetical protein